ncbi:DNRLRE domain-containing protein, partial [Paenibacillus gorillae]|uniref:DNRLRE domain-containing protein n=1 Tax=Paenibacillus gorillae TaxID=1243662 RepID=UPI0005A995EB
MLKGKKRLLFLIVALFAGLLAPVAGKPLQAAAGTTTQAINVEADLVWDSVFGVFDNDTQGRIYVGTGPAHEMYTSRGAVRFNLGTGPLPGRPIKYELQLYVNFKEGGNLTSSYLDVFGSSNDSMTNADGSAFPSSTTAESVRITNDNIPPSGNIIFDVTSIVESITSAGDQEATFVIKGNEAILDARVFLASKEHASPSYQPKLIVTYALNSPPTGSIAINNGAAYTNSSNVTLNLTASDSDAGDVLQMKFSNDNTTWSLLENFASSKSWTLPGGDGLKTVYYQLTDGTDTVTFSDTITLDTTKPIVSGVANNGLYNTNRTVTFNEGTATLNGNAFTSGTVVSAEGAYVLIVTDAAGNVTNVTFTIDKTPPTVSGVANGQSYNTNRTITYSDGAATLDGALFTSGSVVSGEGTHTLIVTDAADNVTTIVFTIDKTAPVVSGVTNNVLYNTNRTVTFNEGTATLNGNPFISGTAVSADGVYTLVVTDAAGNVTNVTFTIDKTPPTVSGVANGLSYNADRTITYSDGTATLDGAPFTSGSVVSGEGTHTLIVTDAAGNVTTIVFTIDKTAPIVSGVTNNGLYNTNRTVTFNEGTATLNGSAFTSGTVVSADGVYTLVVTDSAGNVTNVTFTIDKTPPTVNGVVNGLSYNADRTITYSDGTATLDGAPFTSGSVVSGEGTHTLIVTDAADNVTTIVFTIDKTAPIVTGVTNNGRYNTDHTISFNEGTATLNGAPFISGSIVSAEDDYTLVVTDAAGNVTTISFTINKT